MPLKTWLSRPWAALSVSTLILATGGGMMAGLGAFTFSYGEGLSYFSTDPQACANCHAMQGHLESWQKSGHHHAASCVACHLPHDFVGKYISKADNGFFHSWDFTFDGYPDRILMKERNRRILENNCVGCHRETSAEMAHAHGTGESTSCLHCHARVGHGPTR
jgi:cytochrome c nitrite reductase small subunit